MAKIKKTKNELKTQRETLARFHRFLPTLELKKQQLQREVRQVDSTLRGIQERWDDVWDRLRPWAMLLETSEELLKHARLVEVVTGSTNIAGVTVPLYERVEFADEEIDYYATPAWLDDAVPVLRGLIALAVERIVVQRERELLAEELRITAQRVNLFEKVMIPRTEEVIRVIRIALGDAQTAGVARAKIAKSKGQELVSGAT